MKLNLNQIKIIENTLEIYNKAGNCERYIDEMKELHFYLENALFKKEEYELSPREVFIASNALTGFIRLMKNIVDADDLKTLKAISEEVYNKYLENGIWFR